MLCGACTLRGRMLYIRVRRRSYSVFQLFPFGSLPSGPLCHHRTTHPTLVPIPSLSSFSRLTLANQTFRYPPHQTHNPPSPCPTAILIRVSKHPSRLTSHPLLFSRFTLSPFFLAPLYPFSSGHQRSDSHDQDPLPNASPYPDNRYSAYGEMEKVAPPRSTGMLAEWRKADRGKVLMKVRPSAPIIGSTYLFIYLSRHSFSTIYH